MRIKIVLQENVGIQPVDYPRPEPASLNKFIHAVLPLNLPKRNDNAKRQPDAVTLSPARLRSNANPPMVLCVQSFQLLGSSSLGTRHAPDGIGDSLNIIPLAIDLTGFQL